MEWIPWFDGPHARRDARIFALRADYSAVDLLCKREIDGEWKVFMVDGTPIDDIDYCAWMLAPESTPRYEIPEERKLKAVR